MSIRELYEWYDYYNEEPFFADRMEIQLATVCTMIAGFGKKKPKHSDYMIRKIEKPKINKKDYQQQLKTALMSL